MEQNQKIETSQFYRFQLFQGDVKGDGKIEKTKTVGMAYLKEGQGTYTLRLWTFVENRFYLLQNKTDASRYVMLTRELNKSQNPRTKFYWNIVGNGQSETTAGVIQLQFDLFERPIYMSVFPEASASGATLPEPVELDSAA
ncbi:MAG: hypothetical protein EXR74_09775 [Bdellovibrionales bacterium]|nr:hypothetical protein [Bdellovibrionales bacterium]